MNGFHRKCGSEAAPEAFVFCPKVLRKIGQGNEILTNFCYRSFSIGFTINASTAWKLVDCAAFIRVIAVDEMSDVFLA
jgi:hypothetical protein